MGGVAELLSMGEEGIPIRHLVMTPAAFEEEKGAKIRKTAEQKGVKVSSFSDGSALRGKNWTLYLPVSGGKRQRRRAAMRTPWCFSSKSKERRFVSRGSGRGGGDILRTNGKIQDLEC